MHRMEDEGLLRSCSVVVEGGPGASIQRLRLHMNRDERRGPRALAVLGVIGCVSLGVALPASSVIGGTVLLAGGAAVFALRHRRSRRNPPEEAR
jgi:hypothetical protein